MDLGLKGKKALVCAASKGLGLACAESLAKEGADLFICARSEDTLRQQATTLAAKHNVQVQYRAVDLAIPSHAKELAEEVKKSFGTCQILVNNIGGPPPSAAVSTELEQWQKGFQQVFLSSTLLSQALLADMRAQKFGRILTITSLSVLEPIDHLVVSTSMRAAVTAFTKTLAKEVAADGVTANTVMPGVIHTGRIEDLRRAKAKRDGTSLEEEMRRTHEQIPMGRMGRPEELGDLITFLASERASYITGMNFSVDGGLRRGW